jgi:hypothetical protein
LGKLLPLLGVLVLAADPAGSQNLIWQSDLQVRSFSVSESEGHLIARVSVTAELGEARAARVEVLLPVAVGIVRVGAGCAPGPSPPGVPSLRARVVCIAGDLRPRDVKEFTVTTTTPPPGMDRRFGVMAMSDTPDPKPGNNFAERVIPPGEQPPP